MKRDIRDDFDDWTEKWEKAQKEGIFKDKKIHTPTPQNNPDTYFGLHNSESTEVRDVDAKYWNSVLKLSNNEILNEELKGEDVPVTKPDNKSVAQITDDLGKLPNPVHTSTRGPDQRLKVTPNWTFGPDIEKLAEMKVSLQELEGKMATDPMLEEKKTKNVLSQIDSLKKKIDELSDSLAPEFRDEYLS